MLHTTSDGRTIHLVHTWRDGSYFYCGEYGIDLERVGAVSVGENFGIETVVEIRHRQGQGMETIGELFQWKKTDIKGWVSTHFGRYSESFLVENEYIV